MEFFDSHCHYNDKKFDTDRQEIINKVKIEGVSKFVCVGYNVESSKQAIDIALKHNGAYAVCGVSPNDVPDNIEELEYNIGEIEKFLKNAKNNKVVAVGEIGLDYYWNTENKEIQKRAFIDQIKIANKYNLPVVIHTREATNDTIDILSNIENANNKGVFHCCPLNQELIKRALKLGFYISFAGSITFKNSKNADDVIRLVPLEKLLIETDSPYLTPEPNRGKRNDSRSIKYIAEKIAKIKGVSTEQIAKSTYNNAIKIFKINE